MREQQNLKSIWMYWSRIIFPLIPQESSILSGILKFFIYCYLFKVTYPKSQRILSISTATFS